MTRGERGTASPVRSERRAALRLRGEPSPGSRNPGSARPSIGRRSRTAWLYVLPALILVVGIVYVGIGYTGWASTLDWNGMDPDPRSVGAGNFLDIAADPTFWATLWHVAVFAVATIGIQMVIGLGMALLLGGPVRGKGIYKVLMFIPVVLAPAAIATAFRGLLAPDGEVNGVLHALGLDWLAHAWLADPKVALFALIGINIWQWTGFSFLLYQAAVSQIDQDLFEAAALDGAGTWRQIGRIVVPQLKGTHTTLVMTGIIGSLKTFDIVFLTTGGGPGTSTEFLTTYIYKQAVQQFHAGYASALSMVMLALALTLTVLQMRAYRFGED